MKSAVSYRSVIPVLGPDSIPVDHLVTEDDTPVDNVFSEREQRLLVDSLYVSWPGPGKGRPFLALANVGVFFSPNEPPVVPDFLLALDVQPVKSGKAPLRKRNRAYFTWIYNKAPDVVIEIVSNRKGGERGYKLSLYAEIGIPYYVIHDPDHWLSDITLEVFQLQGRHYRPMKKHWLPKVGLGLELWVGQFERFHDDWLRWCNKEGQILLTGEERATLEKQRADRLAAQLRKLGVKPEE